MAYKNITLIKRIAEFDFIFAQQIDLWPYFTLVIIGYWSLLGGHNLLSAFGELSL